MCKEKEGQLSDGKSYEKKECVLLQKGTKEERGQRKSAGEIGA